MSAATIPAADPQVRGTAAQPRLSYQCAVILAMLQVGPCTGHELATVAQKYTSRISDIRAYLRRTGSDRTVACTERNHANGYTLYELVPALAPCLQGGEP